MSENAKQLIVGMQNASIRVQDGRAHGSVAKEQADRIGRALLVSVWHLIPLSTAVRQRGQPTYLLNEKREGGKADAV